MKRNAYRVTYERDETGAWIVEIPELKGCHSWGKSVAAARANIREALGLFVDDAPAAAAEFEEMIVPPAAAKGAVEKARTLRAVAENTAAAASVALREAVRQLLDEQHLTIRDVAELLGISFQRVQQLAAEQDGGGATRVAERAAAYRAGKRRAAPVPRASARTAKKK